MKIFVLDDNDERLKSFKKYLPHIYGFDCVMVFAKDVAEARGKLVEFQPFDVAFLDHDLGDEIFVPSINPNTGFRVAEFIKDNDIGVAKVFVHSLNAPGSIKMEQLLKL